MEINSLVLHYSYTLLHGENMSIEQRARLLVTELGVSQSELQEKSGISKQVWSNAFRGKQRMNSAHIEFLCAEYSDYVMWLCTGNATYGMEPKNAKLLSDFSRVAKRYAEALSHIEYMAAVSEFVTMPINSDSDNFDFPSSPKPSDRLTLQEKILADLVSQDFQGLVKTSDLNASESSSVVNEFFRKKSLEKLLELENRYHKDSAKYLMLSRLLGEFLIPGSRSNFFEPLGELE